MPICYFQSEYYTQITVKTNKNGYGKEGKGWMKEKDEESKKKRE